MIKHQTKLKHANETAQKKISNFVSTPLERSIKSAEIKLCMFAVDQNLSMSTFDRMPAVLKSVFNDSNIAKGVKLGRTKATAIVKNVTGKYSFEKLVSILKTQQFSIIIDESTAIDSKKSLVVIVRYMDTKNYVREDFFTLIEVPEATAQIMFEKLVACFKENNIPYKTNLIGFASDGASVMVGKHNSVSKHFKNEIPHLFVMRCICHSFHIVASNASKKIPDEIEFVCREIFSFFHLSAKRQYAYKEFQEFLNLKPHKLLHPCQTRWLSLHASIKRIIEQYAALILFFTGTFIDDTSNKIRSEAIYRILEKNSTKYYFEFLDFILPIFTKLNLQMQSEDIRIHVLFEKIQETLKILSDIFIKNSYLLSLSSVFHIDLENYNNFKSLDELYFGSNCEITETNMVDSELNSVKTNCRHFLIEACSEMIKRFDFSGHGKVLQMLDVIKPNVLKEKVVKSLIPICKHLPNILEEKHFNELDLEFMSLKSMNLGDIPTQNIQEFWNCIFEMKNGDGQEKFPTIRKLISYLFCLPHSGASAERAFSTINLNKTKLRNSLESSTLCGIMHTKNMLKKINLNDVHIENDCMNLHCKKMYED